MRWWRGLDSNQRTLSDQIYSLADLTTLPPLQNRAGDGASPGARTRRSAVYGDRAQLCQPQIAAPRARVAAA